jgi:antitoxin VapB
MYTEFAMALHIRSARVDTLARQLVEKTGETLTDAIGNALAEKLQRLDADRSASREAKVAELLAIAAQATGLRKETKTARELIEELYDEDGLPI